MRQRREANMYTEGDNGARFEAAEMTGGYTNERAR